MVHKLRRRSNYVLPRQNGKLPARVAGTGAEANMTRKRDTRRASRERAQEKRNPEPRH